ncbi:MAG: hypothetical protein CVU39_01455 [Chloroflexi bacterium HGW-Chloroflexi-10]|nr:MAG: hypothetical protein CVU39_01455 [Chloroflexi bacterium HGW-Chloroflexi-10]
MNSSIDLKDTVYQRKDYSVSMVKANVYVLLLTAPLTLIIAAAFGLLWGIEKMLDDFSAVYESPAGVFSSYAIFLLVMIVGIALHEFIHGVTWSLAGCKPWRSIKFGFQWKTFTPYTHCLEPLPVNAYRIGTLMPGLLTGVFPVLVGLAIGDLWVTFFGGLFLLSAGGDALILWLLRKVAPSALVEDHPTQAGCYVLEAINN